VMYTLSATGKDGLETDALLACIWYVCGSDVAKGGCDARRTDEPRGFSPRVFVLCPMSHIALTLSAEKPTSLHSNTTRAVIDPKAQCGCDAGGIRVVICVLEQLE